MLVRVKDSHFNECAKLLSQAGSLKEHKKPKQIKNHILANRTHAVEFFPESSFNPNQYGGGAIMAPPTILSSIAPNIIFLSVPILLKFS